MESLMSGGKAMSFKKSRVKYTQRQTEQLERIFERNQYPDTDTQEKLAADIGVSVERIAIWFQNRRSKFKRQCHNTHVTWMRRQIYSSNENTNRMFGTPPHPGKPVCHVLSPLESQILRDDVITMSTPGFKSPCGVTPSTGRLHGTPTLTPEILHHQKSCALDVSGPCVKGANFTNSLQDSDMFLLDAISRIPHELSFEGIQSPERITQKNAQQSALNSPMMNDPISIRHATSVSCDVRKSFKHTNQQEEVDSYVIDKENAPPHCTLQEHTERSPSPLFELYTPMDLRLPKIMHNNIHETAGFNSPCSQLTSDYHIPKGTRRHNTEAMQTIGISTNDYSSSILEEWI